MKAICHDFPASHTLRSSSAAACQAVQFTGRGLFHHERIFGFDRKNLAGLRVLDVAAGAASFTIEATLLGAEAVAADPLYRFSRHALVELARLDAVLLDQLAPSGEGESGRGTLSASTNCSREDFNLAREQFLADFSAGFPAGRYRAQALPCLEFADATFDLVFCANFLFLPVADPDFEFHLAALRELARVARGRAYVYPLPDSDGRFYPALDKLRRTLANTGVDTCLEKVELPFRPASDQRLALYTVPEPVFRKIL